LKNKVEPKSKKIKRTKPKEEPKSKVIRVVELKEALRNKGKNNRTRKNANK